MASETCERASKGGRVLVAMSGGVDSSVTALLLKEAGYDCIGATMRLFDFAGAAPARNASCCRLADVEDAKCVAWSLGIPHQVVDLSEQFDDVVIKGFVNAYEHGTTPNPCVACNRFLKFGLLFDKAKELGCDFIATGHYARISSGRDGFHLLCGVDPDKDQSYVLYMLSQEQLVHTLLPLGGLSKAQTRAIAQEHGFVNARKHDSQDICFVPDGDYVGFLESQGASGLEPGDFVDAQGCVVGHHAGIVRYTVGQRKGLGIASEGRIYVTGIDASDNTVRVGDHESLRASSFVAVDARWTSSASPTGPFLARARIHYHGRLCDVEVNPESADTVRVTPLSPLYAVAPGQAVVFYAEDEVIGGATIARSFSPALT